MSQLIFPNNSQILTRSVANGLTDYVLCNVGPQGAIFFFDGSGNLNAISSSYLYITASWADSASTALSSSWAPGSTPFNQTGSIFGTASWAVNVVNGGGGGGSNLVTGSTVPITSSVALVAIAGGTQLLTGSTVPITASQAISASWSPNQGATTLFTASTYQVTASVALNAPNAVSASFSTFAATGPAVLPTGSTQNITSSWANNVNAGNVIGTVGNATSASYSTFAQNIPAVLATGSTQNITSSWANNVAAGNVIGTVANATSASYATFASNIPAVLPTGSTQNITSSWAQTSSYVSNEKATFLFTGSIYQITSSWAISSSFLSGSQATASLFGTASWAINTVNGGGGGSNLITGSLVPITSSWAVSSSYATTMSFVTKQADVSASWASQSLSASWAPGSTPGTTLFTGSTYQITSSQALTSSFVWGQPTFTVTAPPFNANNRADVTGIDSTVAIQSAINACSSSGYVGTVFFPAGWYQISGSITIPKKVMLAGESNFGINAYGSYLRRTSTTTASMFTVTNAGSFGMRNLSLDGALNSSQSVGLNILSSSVWNIENCNFIQWGTGVIMRYSWIGRFHNCQLNYNTTSFDYSNQVNSIDIRDCHVSANTTAISCSGDITLNCGLVNIEGSDFEGNVNSIILSPAAWATNIRGNYFEGNTGTDILLSGSLKTNIEANHFTGNDPVNIGASQSLYTTIRDNNFYSSLSTSSLLLSNSYIQRYGNAYADTTNPIIFESNSTFGFVNDKNASSFANLIQGASSWANNSVSSSYATFAQNMPAVLSTGSTQNITSSWAVTSSNSVSSSYALFASTFPAVLTSGSTQNITSSWAVNANSGSVMTSSANTTFYLDLSNTGSGLTPTFVSLNLSYNPATGSLTSTVFSGALTGSVFGTSSWTLNGGGSNLITGSTVPITASWAISSSQAVSASWAPSGGSGGSNLVTGSTVPITSSWSITSSYEIPYQPYNVITTSSAQWITASFNLPNQQVNLTRTASYNFTHSNMGQVGQVSDLLLYVTHSAATGTSSFSFPSTWQNIGSGWPSTINANTVAMFWLRCIDSASVIGTYNFAGAVYSASWATNASTASQGMSAWGSFLQTSTITSTAYNISSITRLSAGSYGLSFTNGLNPPYAATYTGVSGSAANLTASVGYFQNPKSTSVTMSTYLITSGLVAADFTTASVHIQSN
jgi:hypothetical protein